MIVWDEDLQLVYCDCCGNECTGRYEEVGDQHICFDCLKYNGLSEQTLCNCD